MAKPTHLERNIDRLRKIADHKGYPTVILSDTGKIHGMEVYKQDEVGNWYRHQVISPTTTIAELEWLED